MNFKIDENLPLEFVDLLRESGVDLVIDVRSMPRSRAGYKRIARTLRIDPPTLSTRFLDAEGLA